MGRIRVIVLALATYVWCVNARAPPRSVPCDAPAQLQSGLVCGTWRRGTDGVEYASFRGVPYAKQPVGELRFKELQPAEKWDVLYATEEGPICPQDDVFYGRLMCNHKQSEACIHANIHVPKDALPAGNRITKDLYPPYPATYAEAKSLPILVFIHGGGFAFGSGDADLHGPERLVAEGVIVITFNYRLNVFGFLSLNSSTIPGNNGLRDMVTLLKWVHKNARAFGGDPDDITLAGQSAGASAAHLLTLSSAAEGLFKRAILMSGTAIPSYYTTSPVYAQFVSGLFLASLGINSTDPDAIHRQLIELPLEKIMDANKNLQFQIGIEAFLPVIESSQSGFTTIIEENTEVSLANGRGKDIPLVVGFTNMECESFRPRFEELDILTRLAANPLQILSPNVVFSVPPDVALAKAKQVEQRYFNGTPTIDKYVKSCSDTFFVYPSLKLAEYRKATGGAPMYLYQFAYDAEYSVLEEAMETQYNGSAHVEDLTFVFQVNSVKVPDSYNDDQMWRWMTEVVTNFMRYSQPTWNKCDAPWPPIDDEITYHHIQSPTTHKSQPLAHSHWDVLQFFNRLQKPAIES